MFFQSGMTSLPERIYAANVLAPTLSLPTATCAAMPLGLPFNEALRATPANDRLPRRMAFHHNTPHLPGRAGLDGDMRLGVLLAPETLGSPQ